MPGDAPPPPVALAVLVSGQGTLLEELAHGAAAGALPARIVLVLADRPDVPALDRARRLGLPAVELPRRGLAAGPWSDAVHAALEAHGAELLLLDGFLSILPASLLARWSGRVLNVHPSLLPRHGGTGMYGARVHEAVLASGDRETGVTVHLVTADVDAGPILVQLRTPVLSTDTPSGLRERLRPLEVRAITEALRTWRDARPSKDRTDGSRVRGSVPL